VLGEVAKGRSRPSCFPALQLPSSLASWLASSLSSCAHVDSHFHSVCRAVDSGYEDIALPVNIASTFKWRKPKKIRHLRRFYDAVDCWRVAGTRLFGGGGKRSESGRTVRGGHRRARALRVPKNLVNTLPRRMGPVACSIHSDVAPRSAVRRVGPRPDPTRSAGVIEPGGTAIRPGDNS
jgi:hypothetical protein